MFIHSQWNAQFQELLAVDRRRKSSSSQTVQVPTSVVHHGVGWNNSQSTGQFTHYIKAEGFIVKHFFVFLFQVGPVFFNVNVNGEIYLRLVRDLLPILLNGLQLPEHIRRDIVYMHDGASAHFANPVRAYLNQHYEGAWIGRGGPIMWPARSPDLNPLDYFFWGHVKQIISQGNPELYQQREAMGRMISDAFNRIRNDPALLQRSVEDIIRRANLCLEREGRHFEQIP